MTLSCQMILHYDRMRQSAGDLNIASRPEDQYRLANSKMSRDKLLEDFFANRPDRQWFRDFLEEK